MAATITRLRIAGFKSFAEPTTVEILPGLTGIVGPNGCGKSNVVEALRWAMGETSARALRGGEMDEVIFAGSAARPARSIAEVVVTLEDAAGLAPAPLAGEPELQVSRRIERGAGSTYRVNGREMRARDIQTVFADVASGARSSAMVSQGRVAFLVDARPEDRRSVLDEAAGITGLHVRRHEAELRLRAAETNLARVADARVELEGRHATLAAQAEAAQAYRLAASTCETAEYALLAILLGRAARARSDAARVAAATMAELTAAKQAALEAGEAERAAEAAFIDASEQAALAAPLLERARAASVSAEADERRAAEALDALQVRLEENLRDHAAAAHEADAAAVAYLALLREAEAVRGSLDNYPTRHAAALAERDSANLAATREAARSEARRTAITDEAAARSAADEAAGRAATAGEELEGAHQLVPTSDAMEQARDLAAKAAVGSEAAFDALAAAQARRRETEDAWAAWSREAAGLREAILRADTRLCSARQRRERLAVEHSEASTRRADAVAGRSDPSELAGASALVADALQALASATETLRAAEQRRADTAAASQAADARAGQAAALARDAAAALEQATRERGRLARLEADCAAEQSRLDSERVVKADLAHAHAGVASHAAALRTSRQCAVTAEHDREAALAQVTGAHAELASLQAERAAASAELEALSNLLADENAAGLLESVEVPEPLEAAFAAALGDALNASLADDAARQWRNLGRLAAEPELPPAAKPLLALIEAPQAMSRALSQAGLVDDLATGHILQSELLPGQALVTADGALFRWDGLVVRGGPVTRAAECLRTRRRIVECRSRLAALEVRSPAMTSALTEAMARRDAAAVLLAQARAAVQRHDAALDAAQTAALSLAGRDVETRARADAVAAERERVASALAEATGRETSAQTHAKASDDTGPAADARDACRYAEQAAASERDARQAVRASEATLAAREAYRRQLADRDDGASVRLAALDPALARLGDELIEAEAELEAASVDRHRLGVVLADRESRSGIAEDHAAAQRLEAGHRQAHAATLTGCDEARALHAKLVRLAHDAATRIAILEPQAKMARAAELTARARLQAAAVAREALDGETGAFDAARDLQTQAQRQVAALEARDAQDRVRLASLAPAVQEALHRRDSAGQRTAELQARLVATRTAHAALLDDRPRINEATSRSSQTLEEAAARHSAASARGRDRQAFLLAERDRRRDAEARLATARESTQRADLLAAQAVTAGEEIAARANETAPNIVPAGNPSPSAEAEARRRLAAAMKARDGIGPVNLLAEREAAETGERLAALVREADELDQAVSRLRGSIGQLNREGRDRLSASFVQIDQQFRALFSRMFEGGRAHLALVGPDDPLEAGLEIYAQPPGKKLSTLSLLSGGEQALTALSLIFAVFRCNPAPVCVLDEVDAPLDDANVERFCRLVSDMARETGTRFLVVTHHQLTMANMDRLYGVTMQERGVSRLLSVDLRTAEAFVE